MKAVFADTFYFLALLKERDPAHDCISFVVMQDEKLNEAFTGDSHFEQAGFKALLV